MSHLNVDALVLEKFFKKLNLQFLLIGNIVFIVLLTI